MTSEEKNALLQTRNKIICEYYLTGKKLVEVARHFQLGRQRILQILKQGGVWKPYVRSARTRHLGVTVTQDAKDALKKKADEQGISVSQLVADAVDDLVQEN